MNLEHYLLRGAIVYLTTVMVLRKISQSVTTVNIYSMTALAGYQLESYALVCFKILTSEANQYYIFVEEVCVKGEVHLVGGDGVSRGRVEYCHNGTWYSVCADGLDPSGDKARSICNALGYNNSHYGMKIPYNKYVQSLFFCPTTRFSIN